MLKTFPFLAFILIATPVYAQNVVCDPLCHQGTTTTTPTTTTGGGTAAQGAPPRQRVPEGAEQAESTGACERTVREAR